MTLLRKKPVIRVEKLLKEFDNKLGVIALKTSARTASEAATSLGCEVGAIVKSLLFKTETTFTMCLIAGDKKASLNKIKKTLRIEDAFMASAEEVGKYIAYVASPAASFITGANCIIDGGLTKTVG